MRAEKSGSLGASPRLELLVKILVFLFPVLVATAGAGSYILFLLVLPALFYGRGWSSLHGWERRLLWGYAIAFLVISLSLINAEELREGLKALDRYFRIALIIPLYLMFRRMGWSMGRELALGAMVAGFVMLGQAIYQVEWLLLPSAIGHYHKIIFGDLAVLWAAVVALFAMIAVKHPFARLLFAVSVVAAIYASLLSQARGGWLFIPPFIVVLLWLQCGRLRLRRGWVIMALLIVAVGAMQVEQVNRGVMQGIDDLQLYAANPAAGSSWGDRLNLWRNSLLLLQDHPLLGTGLGDFQVDMERLVKDGIARNRRIVAFTHAHSIYFDTLAKGGILGFLATVTAYLILPFLAFWRGLRGVDEPWQRFYALGGVMFIAAFATFGLSEGLWTRNAFVNTYVICLVVFMAGMVNSREQAESEMDHRLSS